MRSTSPIFRMEDSSGCLSMNSPMKQSQVWKKDLKKFRLGRQSSCMMRSSPGGKLHFAGSSRAWRERGQIRWESFWCLYLLQPLQRFRQGLGRLCRDLDHPSVTNSSKALASSLLGQVSGFFGWLRPSDKLSCDFPYLPNPYMFEYTWSLSRLKVTRLRIGSLSRFSDPQDYILSWVYLLVPSPSTLSIIR